MNKKTTLAIAVAISAAFGTETQSVINDMDAAYQVFMKDLKNETR